MNDRIKNLTTYDNYKPSGVDFMSDIPNHWNLKRLKDVISLIQSGTTPKSSDNLTLPNQIIDWFTPFDFKQMTLNNTNK